MADKKVQSLEDLKKLQEKFKKDLDLRLGSKGMSITIHMGTCGIGAGARDMLSALADALSKANREDVVIQQSGCLGYCEKEPMMTLRDENGKEYCYGLLDKAKIRRIVSEHVIGGTPVAEYIVNF